MKKLTLILIFIFLTSLTYPIGLISAYKAGISVAESILDEDFWSDEMHIKCTSYKAYYEPKQKQYYVVIKFVIVNVMSEHNLERFKIRILNYSPSVSCIIDSPNPISIDQCAMDGDYTCFYYESSIKLLPNDMKEFTIVGLINDSNFDVVHTRLCFHAMQRWWLRATPICFDIKFRKEKILPKGVEIVDEVEDNTGWMEQ